MFVMVSGWRERHADDIREVNGEINAAARVSDKLHKELAGELDIFPQHWSRTLKEGANLTALVVLGRLFPTFGAAWWFRIGELMFGPLPFEWRERPLWKLEQLPRREPKVCAGVSSVESSQRSSRSA